MRAAGSVRPTANGYSRKMKPSAGTPGDIAKLTMPRTFARRADRRAFRDARWGSFLDTLAHQISAGLDGELHDALDDLTSFLGQRVRK